jgi:antitoxin MazE
MIAKLVSIGNSRGVRIPRKLIEKYHLSDTIIIEEAGDGLFIKPELSASRLSWEETYKEMAESGESWVDFEDAVADGLDNP